VPIMAVPNDALAKVSKNCSQRILNVVTCPSS
jgi:hypothetical protein